MPETSTHGGRTADASRDFGPIFCPESRWHKSLGDKKEASVRIAMLRGNRNRSVTGFDHSFLIPFLVNAIIVLSESFEVVHLI